MSKKLDWFRASPERLEQVIREIDEGSDASTNFFLLLTTATLIASIGLIANSTALIVAAMLVCPLMIPMLGIALAIIHGNPGLLRRSMRSEAIGIALEVGIAVLIGLFPLAIPITPEMLTCTRPTLLDLLVALLAGFAGTYAMIDEHLSPVLPGVAIATAIVPPLANTGLCLALGAWYGAIGSFVLFLANFFSIILIAALTFMAAGVTPTKWLEKWTLARQLVPAGLGFLLVTVILAHTFVKIIQERYLDQAIKAEITSEFSRYPATSLVGAIKQQYQDKLYILATIRTPKVIPPDAVKKAQATLTQKLQRPAELIVRCSLTKDVSATGSTSGVTTQNLDRFFLTRNIAPEVLKVQLAEQALREILTDRPGLNLMDVDLLHFPQGPFVLATIQGARALMSWEIQEMEKVIQDRLQDPGIRLLGHCLKTMEMDRHGRILYGWSHFERQTQEETNLMGRIAEAVKNEFKRYPEVFITNVDAAPEGKFWAVRLEAAGARLVTPQEAAAVEKAVSHLVKQPVKIYLWSRIEAIATSGGYIPVNELIRKRLQPHEGG